MPDTDNDAPPAGNKVALIVEDDKAIALLLRFIIEREGYVVEWAADGREALKLIETLHPPALVVLDIMLPYVDGFHLLEAVRSRTEWATTPVLMLTSMGGERDIVRALDAGANDYMVKPFRSDELKARIRVLTRQLR